MRKTRRHANSFHGLRKLTFGSSWQQWCGSSSQCAFRYDPSCLTNVGALPPASYEIIKPTVHRLLDGLEHHTGRHPKLLPSTNAP